MTKGWNMIYAHCHRVYFRDTDAYGMVYGPNYFCFLEEARVEMLRSQGIPLAELESLGIDFVIRDYVAPTHVAPAHLDDLLEIRSELRTMKGASFVLYQEIRRQEDGQTVFRTEVTLVCVINGKPARIPDDINRRLVA